MIDGVTSHRLWRCWLLIALALIAVTSVVPRGGRTEDAAARSTRAMVNRALEDIAARASDLAALRLHDDLFPGQPFADSWRHAATLPYHDRASIVVAASALSRRVAELDERHGAVGTVGFFERRTRIAAANALHVALTGDYAVTEDPVFSELRRRGIATRQLAAD